MAKKYFQDNNGQKYGIDEENLESRMAEAKQLGLTLTEIEKPEEKKPDAEKPEGPQEVSYWKGSDGNRYRIANKNLEARQQEAKELGIELTPWDGKEDLGVFGTMKAEAEAAHGRKMGAGAVISANMPFVRSMVQSYDNRRRAREEAFTMGKIDDPQDMLDKARFVSPEFYKRAQEAVKEAGGELSWTGGISKAPDAAKMKAILAGEMKPQFVESIKAKKDAADRLEKSEELGTWQKIGKNTLQGGATVAEFVISPMATALGSWANRYEGLTANEYDLDENGEPVMVKEGDDALRALGKSGAGAAAEYLIWNKLPGIGGLLAKGVKAVEKIPGVSALTAGAARMGEGAIEKLVGKLQGDAGGRILLKTGDILGKMWDKTKVGSLPTMMMKSRLTEFVDNVVGMNLQGKEREDFAKWWEKITSKEDNVEMLLGMIGVHGVMAAAAGAQGAWKTHAFRKGGATERGGELLSREDLVREFAGEDLAKRLSDEDLGRIFDLAVKCEDNPAKVEAFLEKVKEDQAEGQRMIDEGKSAEEVMNGVRQKMANGEKLQEAAQRLQEQLEKGESLGMGDSVGTRMADVLDRFWEGKMKIVQLDPKELEVKDANRIDGNGGAREGMPAEENGWSDRPVIVFEAADGSRELIAGKKRSAAAAEKGEQVDAVIVREKEGWTAEEARHLNTLDNAREGNLDLKEMMRAVEELEISSELDLERCGIDSEVAEIAVKARQNASAETRQALVGEKGEQVVGSGMLDVLTSRTMGGERDAAQRVMLERVIGEVDSKTARAIAEVLKERAGEIDFGNEKAIDEAIAEGKRRALEGATDADGVPVETAEGKLKTLGEVKAENEGTKLPEKGETTDLGKADETPLWKGVREAGENRGVELKTDANGIANCSRFEGVRVQVQEKGVVVEGWNADVMTRPENIEDAAALMESVYRMAKEAGGKDVIVIGEREAGTWNAMLQTIRMEGEKAYSVEQREKRTKLVKSFVESTGVECRTSAEDWEGVMKANGFKKVWQMRDGQIYGCMYDGKVFLNPTTFRVGAPIHEYGHVVVEIARKVKPELIKRGLELVEKDEVGRKMLEEIEKDETYGRQDRATQLEEVLVHLIEKKGEKMVGEHGVGEELKAWIREVWAELKGYMGIESLTAEEIQDMSLDQVADRLTEQLLSGERMGKGERGRGAKFGKAPTDVTKDYEWDQYFTVSRSGEKLIEPRKDFGAYVKWTSWDGKPMGGSLSPYGTVIPDAKHSRPWQLAENNAVFTFAKYSDIHGDPKATDRGELERMYKEGQKGDAKSALEVVNRFITKEKCQEIAKRYPGAVLIPLIKPTKAQGEHNVIPLVMCVKISKETGMGLNPYFLQQTSNWSGATKRRGKGNVERQFMSVDYAAKGVAPEGTKIVLVDDHMTSGQSFSQARLVAEENGAEVVGCVSLTHSQFGTILGISEKTKTELIKTFGKEFDEKLRERNISGGIDGLTDAMGRIFLGSRESTIREILKGPDSRKRPPSRYDRDSAWSEDRELRGEHVRFGKQLGAKYEPIDRASEEEAAKYRKGDARAFDALMRRHDMLSGPIDNMSKRLYRNANFFTPEEKEDIAQDAMVRLAGQLKKTNLPFSQLYWASIKFKMMDMARKLKRQKTTMTSLDEAMGEDGEMTRADTIAAERSASEGMAELLSSLNLDERQMTVVTGLLEGRSPKEIAAQMKVSVDEVFKVRNEIRRIVNEDRTPASAADSGRIEGDDTRAAEVEKFGQEASDQKERRVEEKSHFNIPVNESLNVRAVSVAEEAAGGEMGRSEKAVAMILEGKTVREIAAELGMKESTVRVHVSKFRKSSGREVKVTRKDTVREKAVAMVLEGKTYREVAAALGIKEASVRAHVSKFRKSSGKEVKAVGKHGVREEAVRLSREGLSTREIALELGLAESTVRSHISTYRKKTGEEVERKRSNAVEPEDTESLETAQTEEESSRESARDAVVRLAKEGKTYREIAKELGKTEGNVRVQIANYRREGGEIEVSRKKQLWQKVAELAGEGLTPTEIADRLGIGYMAVHSAAQRARKMGVKLVMERERRALLGKLTAMTPGEGVAADALVGNDGMRIVVPGAEEGTDAAKAAGLEKREALRPWTKPGAPVTKAQPIAMDTADLLGFMRQLMGAKGRRVELGEEMQKVFGILDEGDKNQLKADSQAAGWWKHEDPAWCGSHSTAEIAWMGRKSSQDLERRTKALFEKRVLTGAGGERKACQVMGSELGRMMLEKRANGSHSAAVGAGLKVVDAMVAAIGSKKNAGLIDKIEAAVAWWHGQPSCPAELKGKPKELGAEMFGMLLTQPESLAKEHQEVYNFCRSLLANSKELAYQYERFCSMKWDGKADNKLLRELDESWDRDNARGIAALEEKAKKGLTTKWDDIRFELHDQWGPMFYFARRSLDKLKAKLNWQVDKGMLPRDVANQRLADETAKIDSLKSGLNDFQRQSDGQERLMVTEFGDVIDQAKKQGVNWRAVRRYAHLMRVIEIGGRATAYGISPDRAAKLLDRMKANVGDNAYAEIESTWRQFRSVYEKFVLNDQRVMRMFDAKTRAMLWNNTHYVTMRHTLSPEERAAYEKAIAEYEKNGKSDPTMRDPTMDMYLRMHEGLTEGEAEAGVELKRLKGSFDPTKDPIAETIKRAVEIKRAATRNALVTDLRDVLLGTEAEGVFDKYKGTLGRDGKLGTIRYMEDGKVHKLVVPKLIEKQFKAKAEFDSEIGRDIGMVTRGLKNTMTLWNPAFVNRAYLLDRAALEANLEGMHKDVVGTVASAIPFMKVPVYMMDNYLARFTNFQKTWVGRLLYNEHTVNYYARDAYEIAKMVHRGEIPAKIREAQDLRAQGKTSEAKELEEKILVAKTMMEKNVFQSKYKFDKLQRAINPDEVLETYGLGKEARQDLDALGKAWDVTKKGAKKFARYEEEQEAVT